MVGRDRLMACNAKVRYMTYATLAGTSVCILCEAGSYGSASGEWMWTHEKGKWNRISCCNVTGFDIDMCGMP